MPVDFVEQELCKLTGQKNNITALIYCCLVLGYFFWEAMLDYYIMYS